MVNQTSLTGESAPVRKQKAALPMQELFWKRANSLLRLKKQQVPAAMRRSST